MNNLIPEYLAIFLAFFALTIALLALGYAVYTYIKMWREHYLWGKRFDAFAKRQSDILAAKVVKSLNESSKREVGK